MISKDGQRLIKVHQSNIIIVILIIKMDSYHAIKNSDVRDFSESLSASLYLSFLTAVVRK